MILDPNLWIISACGDTHVSDAVDAAEPRDDPTDDGDDVGDDVVQTRNIRTIGPEKLLELLILAMSDVRELHWRILITVWKTVLFCCIYIF